MQKSNEANLKSIENAEAFHKLFTQSPLSRAAIRVSRYQSPLECRPLLREIYRRRSPASKFDTARAPVSAPEQPFLCRRRAPPNTDSAASYGRGILLPTVLTSRASASCQLSRDHSSCQACVHASQTLCAPVGTNHRGQPLVGQNKFTIIKNSKCRNCFAKVVCLFRSATM